MVYINVPLIIIPFNYLGMLLLWIKSIIHYLPGSHYSFHKDRLTISDAPPNATNESKNECYEPNTFEYDDLKIY